MKQLISKVLLRVILPLVLVAGGGLIARSLVMGRKAAARGGAPARVAVVETLVAQPRTLPLEVRGTGTVEAANKVTLSAEVQGRIVQRAAALVPGGRFKKGDVIARIDARDYKLALEQEESRVRAAQLELDVERGRKRIAEKEWAIYRAEGGEPTNIEDDGRLALREPHLAAATEALEAAHSAQRRAELNLARTVLRAPMNAAVQSETVEEGLFVAPGAALATLIGTDRFRVNVSVPVEDLAALRIPTVEGELGSAARVIQKLGNGERIERSGHVLRILKQLDTRTRRAQVVVGVDDPLDPPEGGLPLLPGAFVEVILEGEPQPGLFELPRAALYEGRYVWIAAGGSLQRREVRPRFGDAERVFVAPGAQAGLEAGDAVVLTPLSTPLQGMPVEPRAPEGQTAALDAPVSP